MTPKKGLDGLDEFDLFLDIDERVEQAIDEEGDLDNDFEDEDCEDDFLWDEDY